MSANLRNSILFAQGTQRSITSDHWFAHIQAGDYRAVIFDCDGTLVESADAHMQSLQTALRAQGHVMARDWYLARTGLDRQSILHAFADETAGHVDVAAASRDSIAAFIANCTAVQSIAETAQLVRKLHGDCPMAVGTNAEDEVARASLKGAKLLEYFDCISSVSNGLPAKPAPDIFQDATDQLGFAPAQTLVFEDSEQGVEAALSAGLDVIRLI